MQSGDARKRLIQTTAVVAIALLVIGIVVYAVVRPENPPTTLSSGAGTTPGISDKPTHPSMLITGDSFTAGTGAQTPRTGYPCLVAKAMGWFCNVDAQGGTGFINDGHKLRSGNRPLIDRLAADKAQYLADVVIVDAGRNDGLWPAEQIAAAARRYFRTVRTTWPKAEVVYLAPAYLTTTASGAYRTALMSLLRTEVDAVGGVLIDPVAESWYAAKATKQYVSADRIHPNQAGHQYIADRLVSDLRKAGLDKVQITDIPS